MKVVLSSAFLTLALIACSVQANEKELETLQRLVNEKSHQLAYQESLRLIDDWAGDPKFDYLMGLSAYKAGYFEDAVFAFERVLINEPKDVLSRLYLAFGYFKVQNYKASQKELKELQKLPLKQKDMDQVNQYLVLIAKYEASRLKSHSFNVSLSYSYDSNANSGTDLDSYVLPTPIELLPGVTIDEIVLGDTSKVSPDNIMSATLSYQYQAKITQNNGYFVAASLNESAYQELDYLNRQIANFMGGYHHNFKDWQYRVSLYGQPMTLDTDYYRFAYGAIADVNKTLSEKTSLGISLAAADIDNKQDDNFDVSQYSIKTRLVVSGDNKQHLVELGYSAEDAKTLSGEHNARDYWQATYRYSIPSFLSGSMAADISYQDIKHAAVHPSFGLVRKEEQLSFQLAYNYVLPNSFLLSVRYKFTDKDSSIDLYAFDKDELWLSLSHSF